MSFKSLTIWAFTCFLVIQLQAQKSITDSIYTIKGIDIFSTRLESFALGATVQQFDSITLSNHKTEPLSNLLSYSGASIKSNGAGGLSTIMLRGGGSSHTSVIWNGLNIQSPMSGSTDFSIFPVSMFSSVKLQYGGSGTLFGSGAVSGVVHLSNGSLLTMPNGSSITFGLGSANSKSSLVSIKDGNSRVAASIKLFTLESDNDYEFYNSTKKDSPKEFISNAEVSQLGIAADIALQLSNSTSLSLASWYQNSDKNLQTRMSNLTPDSSNQKDNQIYTSSNLKFTKDKISLSIKNGFLYGDINFIDPINNINADNHFNSIINELEGKFRIGENHEILLGLNHTTELAYSDSYISKKVQRERTSLFGSYKISLIENRLKTAFSIRDEIIDSKATPYVFSIGTDLTLTKSLTLKGNISKNYRIPTLNDLYWANTTFAEGNPNLLPESGWSAEIGLAHQISNQNFRFESSATFFRTYINDWIIWLDAQGKYKPFNADKGKTYGGEAKVSLAVKDSKTSILFDGFYTYTHSRVYQNQSSVGEPMIYTPNHKFAGSLTLKWQDLIVKYSHTFNYKRYIDFASLPLPYYNLGDFSTGYRFKNKSVRGEINFQIHNIWNTDYQLTASYAMPLRYYSLALTVDINSNY